MPWIFLPRAGKIHDIEVVPLKVKYPQGAEKNLIEAILDREVPSGKLPIEVGVINASVGTLVSVCQAVRDDRPVIDRVVNGFRRRGEESQQYPCPGGNLGPRPH